MHRLPVLLLLVAVVTSHPLTFRSMREKCRKEDNCRLPDCRCWDDRSIPGYFNKEDTPQIILVSFSYAVNQGNVENYMRIFEGLLNPNGCPAKGTFFVQGRDTSFDIVSQLYHRGHEIAVTSDNGQVPSTLGDWIRSFEAIQRRLRSVGIPDDQVQGVRSPNLFFGGDLELWGMAQSRLSYDSTCVTRNYTSGDSLLWPYTMDFVEGSPSCNIGKTAKMAHPGVWEFLMPVLEFGNVPCSTPSACSPEIKDEYDAFELFFSNFMRHYNGQRSPFIMFLDPLWLSNEDHFRGTRQFLQLLLGGFRDTWLVTYQQALQWIKDPVPWKNASSYPPWTCM